MALIQWEIWASFAATRCPDLYGYTVDNGTRNVFLMSVVPVTFGPLGLRSARSGNNFFTDRRRAAVRCLPTPALGHWHLQSRQRNASDIIWKVQTCFTEWLPRRHRLLFVNVCQLRLSRFLLSRLWLMLGLGGFRCVYQEKSFHCRLCEKINTMGLNRVDARASFKIYTVNQ